MIYIIVCTAIIGIISLISIFYRNKRKLQLEPQRISKALSTISILVVILYMAVAVTAYMHGADLESLQRFGILRTIQAIQKSPVMDKSINFDQQGNILIYYRFGCEDCEAVYDSLKAEIAGKENIYWVASRQSEGQKLLQKYAVSEVPAGVIIQKDGMYISYMLCDFVYDKLDGTSKIQLNTDVLNRLLELQKREVT